MKFKPIVYRSPNSYDPDAASLESGVEPGGPSLTVQTGAEDTDINVIVKRFGLTGEVPANLRVPLDGDFDEIYDYATALRAIRAADDEFMRLPASIRGRFENDPAAFIDFCLDGANADELVKLGLATAKAKAGAVAEEKPAA